MPAGIVLGTAAKVASYDLFLLNTTSDLAYWSRIIRKSLILFVISHQISKSSVNVIASMIEINLSRHILPYLVNCNTKCCLRIEPTTRVCLVKRLKCCHDLCFNRTSSICGYPWYLKPYFTYLTLVLVQYLTRKLLLLLDIRSRKLLKLHGWESRAHLQVKQRPRWSFSKQHLRDLSDQLLQIRAHQD